MFENLKTRFFDAMERYGEARCRRAFGADCGRIINR